LLCGSHEEAAFGPRWSLAVEAEADRHLRPGQTRMGELRRRFTPRSVQSTLAFMRLWQRSFPAWKLPPVKTSLPLRHSEAPTSQQATYSSGKTTDHSSLAARVSGKCLR
ncbi:MAG: hypothetical protein LBI99_05990, partial [Propionibacteriaceae bacterium]|nr:hypothetical protein [Propionibacteriaceae bacterium]